MDGTFKVIKAPFTQLWTIHAFVRGGLCNKQIPLLFCIMSRRRTEDYVAIMRHIQMELGSMEVRHMVSDFEKALWLAVRQLNLNVTMSGVHFTQAIWRKIQSIGEGQSYISDHGTFMVRDIVTESELIMGIFFSL
jgi:hypothetical protein